MRISTLVITFIFIISTATFVLTGCSDTEDDQLYSPASEQSETSKGGEQMASDSQENKYALIQTSMGNMKLELFEKRAPITTSNFINLAQSGYYDGTRFHRIIKNFMIQGGDPLTKDESKKQLWGTGGPGRTIKDEFHEELKHDKIGILSMANAGPDTGGSQFFITLAPTPWLDGKHAVFGQLVEGEEVLQELGSVQTDPRDVPINDVMVEKVSIVK